MLTPSLRNCNELSAGQVVFLRRHALDVADEVAKHSLSLEIGGASPNRWLYCGYLRMLWARWDAGDRTAVPSLHPHPDDVEVWVPWVHWMPGVVDTRQVEPARDSHQG